MSAAARDRVLVTGSTSGIGLATARRLLAAGVDVTITGRRAATVDPVVQELSGAGGDAPRAHVDGAVADLMTAAGAPALMADLANRVASLDGLVLSHGGDQYPELFATMDPADFTRGAEAMLLTNLRVLHAALPLLRRCARGARVVLVTSDAGRYPTTGEAVIGALAAANIMLVRTLARELSRDGIRLNAVAVTITSQTLTRERVMQAGDFSRRLFEKAEARTPFGPITADDVAATITHLLSDGAAKVTGQVVGVTGGLST